MSTPERGPRLTVASWNVLAAPWADPSFYPAEMDPSLLDRERRAVLVAAQLVAFDADVICLQETTPTDLATAVATLGAAYDHRASANGADLWASWSTPDRPWEPNGTAIVWRHDRIADVVAHDVHLSTDGNRATLIEGRVAAGGRPIRVMSLHLDADAPDLRRRQLPVALGALPAGSESIDIVAGDCNEDTHGTDLGAICAKHAFVDALSAVHDLTPTHPYARPVDDYAALARIDHILVRGGSIDSGQVLDGGVWDIEEPGPRLEAHLRRTGSDHLPLVARVAC